MEIKKFTLTDVEAIVPIADALNDVEMDDILAGREKSENDCGCVFSNSNNKGGSCGCVFANANSGSVVVQQ